MRHLNRGPSKTANRLQVVDVGPEGSEGEVGFEVIREPLLKVHAADSKRCA